MLVFWRFLKYCFASKKHDVKGKFILVGPEKSGKSTLLDAAEACENKNYDFHCKAESVYDHTSINYKDRWGDGLFEFSVFDTKFAFYVPGDWGGAPELQRQILDQHLDTARHIIYCFDVNKMFSGGTIDRQKEQFSTADYTMGFIRSLLKRMEGGARADTQRNNTDGTHTENSIGKMPEKKPPKKHTKKNISVKSIIFLGTHTDLLKNQGDPEEIRRKAMRELNFDDLQKEIKLKFPKINVCLVCGSWLDYKNSSDFWVSIAKEIQKFH